MSGGAVLVAGGAGYIGSHVCKALAAAGRRPVVLDSLVHGHRWAVRWGPLEVGDIADAERVAEVVRRHGVTSLVHCAAFIFVGESMRAPLRYFANNVAGSIRLLEACVEAGVREVVFSSTAAVYGEPRDVPIPEAHATLPINPYGESKLMVERVLAWLAAASGLRYAVLRYFNAAGADLDGEIGEAHDPETHLVPLAVLAALGRTPPLRILGADYATADGTAIRDYIHVADLADAHVAALARLEAGGDSLTVNLGTGRGASVREVIAAVERAGERKVPAEFAPRRAGDPPVLVAAPGAATAELGWRPGRSDLDTIVESAWRWHAGTRG
jgi:UDP-glucose-4-epimerase GalE